MKLWFQTMVFLMDLRSTLAKHLDEVELQTFGGKMLIHIKQEFSEWKRKLKNGMIDWTKLSRQPKNTKNFILQALIVKKMNLSSLCNVFLTWLHKLTKVLFQLLVLKIAKVLRHLLDPKVAKVLLQLWKLKVAQRSRNQPFSFKRNCPWATKQSLN